MQCKHWLRRHYLHLEIRVTIETQLTSTAEKVDDVEEDVEVIKMLLIHLNLSN